MGRYDDVADRLDTISEELADLALELLREASEDGTGEVPLQEKRLTRARRAVDKAVHLLRDNESFDDD